MSPSPDSMHAQERDKLRVLVVDDEPTLRLGFAYALTNRATIVETAATGNHALERIALIKFDIMILDLRMPELDGIGVIEALRSQGNNIPIILCSAVLNPKAALSAIRHGVVDFLLKPVRPVDLRQVLDFVMRPERRALPMAMQAVRRGRRNDAIALLEEDQKPSRQAAQWLNLLRLIRDADDDGNSYKLEEQIRDNMAILAFNAPTVS